MRICSAIDCVGCGVCRLVCPKGAIAIKEDWAGFRRPIINFRLCMACGACVRSCPVNRCAEERLAVADYYGGAAKDVEEAISSTSGGVANVLARQVIQDGGIVFGAAFNPFPTVEHICVDTVEGLVRLKGSKYVESDISKALPLVKAYLTAGYRVLFIGLPCHIAALYGYIGGSRKGLATVDLVCHGKPPQKLFTRWVKTLQNKVDASISDYKFRNKCDCAWNDVMTHYHSYCLTDGRRGTIALKENWYGRYFLGGVTFRKSCYRCRFARVPRVADITLADFWGGEKDPRFSCFIQTGLSLVSVQSVVGQRLLMDTCSYLNLIKVEPEFAQSCNRGLVCCTRHNFYRRIVFLFVYLPEWLRFVCDAIVFGSAGVVKRIVKWRHRQ